MSTRIRRTKPPRGGIVVIVALVVMLLAGCRLDVGIEIAVESDTSGVLAVELALNRELAGLLERNGIDPEARLRDALGERWSLAVTGRDGGGRRLRVSADFADPSDLRGLVASLAAGLDDTDPRLLGDVDLRVLDDGDVELQARAGLIPPVIPGVAGDGAPLTPEEFAELLAARRDEVVSYVFAATLPGEVVEVDGGGEVIEDRVVWRPALGETRRIRVVADPPGVPWATVAAVATGAAAAVGALAWARRRRVARRGGRAPREGQ